MPPTESTRLELRQCLLDTVGDRATELLMESLPPVDYTRVATIDDVDRLSADLSRTRGELIGRIDTSGAALRDDFAGLRVDFADVKTDLGSLRNDLLATDTRLTGQITALDTRLTGQITALDTKVDRLDTRLTGQITALDTKVTGQIAALGVQVQRDIVALGGRLDVAIARNTWLLVAVLFSALVGVSLAAVSVV